MSRTPTDAEFSELVHGCWASLYRTAYLLVGDHGLAEDLVQTALTKTYAAWSKVRAVEAAPAYARTTLVNTATGWMRRRSWRKELPTERLPDAGLHSDPSVRPTVIAALGRLAPRQRAVIVLRYYEDLSEAEIATTLGCAPGTVKSQSSAAMKALRRALAAAGVGEAVGES